MPKIKVEIEVPRDCRDCEHFDFYLEVCNLFNNDVFYDEDKDIYERCNECKQSEVQKIKQGFVKNRLTISPCGCNMGL